MLILLYDWYMSTFLKETISKSGMSQADIARAMNITPQALHSLINYPAPKPDSIAQTLRACGWSDDSIAALQFGEVYNLASATAQRGED